MQKWSIQSWIERHVRGCDIFQQSFRKMQIGRWGLASHPWQHYSGKFQNPAGLVVQLCTEVDNGRMSLCYVTYHFRLSLRVAGGALVAAETGHGKGREKSS